MRVFARPRHAFLFALTSGLAAFASNTAFADDTAVAKLVAEADKLAATYRYADACPKYEEAAKLSPSSQSEERAGLCYELWGKKLEAWKHFSAAVVFAEKEKSDRLPNLKLKVELQESRFPKLTITLIPADEVPGLVVKRDGVTLTKNQLNALVPLAPGEHKIEASAPGYKTWSQTVKVDEGQSIPPIRIPQLDEDASAPPPSANPHSQDRENPPPLPVGPSKRDESVGQGQRIAGYVTGGAGIATVIVSIALGINAKATYDQSSGMCDDANRCTPTGLSLRDDASSKATVSTVFFFGGLAITAVGAVLVFTAPSAKSKVTATPGGLRVRF